MGSMRIMKHKGREMDAVVVATQSIFSLGIVFRWSTVPSGLFFFCFSAQLDQREVIVLI